MATSIVGAYWGARKETREACAERLLNFLRALRREDPALGRWFRRMKKKTDPVLPIPDSAAALVDLLTVNLDDSTPRRAIVELGFGCSAWRGFDATAPASFLCTCGCYSTLVGNRFVLTCDDETTSHDLLRIYLKAAVDAFDPDDAIAHDGASLEAAHKVINAAGWERRPKITDPPAIYRYKKGRGFSWSTAAGLQA